MRQEWYGAAKTTQVTQSPSEVGTYLGTRAPPGFVSVLHRPSVLAQPKQSKEPVVFLPILKPVAYFNS